MGGDPRPNTMLLTSNVVAVSKRSLSIGSSTMCCRMAPSKNVRRGRPLRHSPVATRSRAAASRASVARSSMGHIVQHLDDEPAHQQAVHPVVGAAAGRRGTTEERLSSMERRLEASDKMLQEVHAMVRGLQQLPATNALPAPPPIAVPVAMAASAGGEPIAPPLANLCLWPQGGHTPSRVASYAAGVPPSPVPRPTSAPWPEAISSGIHTGNEVHTLPRASRDLVASFATSALSRHSRVSDKLKAQIWSGDYVSISLLLHDSSPQSYSVSVRPGSDDETPMFCVAPRARSSTVSFNQWLQGFEVYMSVFLLQPQHMAESHNMLMYIQTVRSLYEKGADWRSYDEAFRSLRQANNWGWESVCWYLWMNASESRPAATPSGAPFRSTSKVSWGNAKWPSTKTCFAYDRGEVCNAATCRYTHTCRRCGGPHSAVHCYRQQSKPNPARPTSATGNPAAHSSTASSRPAVFRR